MEFLGIGPLELFFIVLIALIILGPQDMIKAGRTIGRILRKTVLSPSWMNVQRKVRSLPYELMREAGLEENEIRGSINDLRNMSRIDLGQDLTRSIQQQYEANPSGNGYTQPTPAPEFTEPPQIPTPSESLQPVGESQNGSEPKPEENESSSVLGEDSAEEPGPDSQQL